MNNSEIQDDIKYNDTIEKVADLLIINTKIGDIIDIDATLTFIDIFDGKIYNKTLYDNVQNVIKVGLNVIDHFKEIDKLQKFSDDLIKF